MLPSTPPVLILTANSSHDTSTGPPSSGELSQWSVRDLDVVPCPIDTLEGIVAFCENPNMHEHPPCASLYLTESGVRDSVLLRLLKLEGACSQAYMIMSHCDKMMQDMNICLLTWDGQSEAVGREQILQQQEHVRVEGVRRRMQYAVALERLRGYAQRRLDAIKRELRPTTTPLTSPEYTNFVTKSTGSTGAPPCSICHESIIEARASHHLSCGHEFHPRCLKRWLHKERPTCPNCRYCPRIG